MIKLGILDVSNINIQGAEKEISTLEQENFNEQINKDKKCNFYEIYINPVNSGSSFADINIVNQQKGKKRNYEMMQDLINYVKENGLTIRQAQKLFNECADYILNKRIL